MVLSVSALPATAASAAPIAPTAAASSWGHVRPTAATTRLSLGQGTTRSLVKKVYRGPSAGGGTAYVTTPRSRWHVTYTNFTVEQQAAFQRAVDIWAGLVASTQIIEVDARLRTFPDPRILGGAKPWEIATSSSGVDYPIALANSLAQQDLAPGASDIFAEFRSDPTGAYYGADPTAIPAGDYDFTSVVLHELGHGLGFIGSGNVDASGIGSYNLSDGNPFVYDLFTQSADTFPVLSRTNNSAVLGQALTSSSGLFWAGDEATGVTAAGEPRLYSPSTFEPGSSYSHLDEGTYPQGNANSLMTPVINNGEVIRDPGNITLGIFADMGWDVPPLPGSRFTPVAPVRVLDTKFGTGVPGGTPLKVGPGGTVDLKVTGLNGVPVEARAVVLNLTVAQPTTATDVRAFPTPRTGALFPRVSNINVAAAEQRANAVTVRVGSGGRVRFRNAAGSAYLIADLAGFYAPSGPSTYHPVTPSRILNTSNGTGVPQAKVGAGGKVDLTVTGIVVPGGATAVVLSLTVVNATTATDVRAYPTPTDASFPRVSSINAVPGRTTPNLVVVQLSSGGKVRFRNAAGSVDLRGDLAGWFGPSSSGQQFFHAVSPQRVLDTRPTPLGAGGTRDLAMAGNWIPTRAKAAVLNVTGVAATAATDVRVYPVSTTVPNTSVLNAVPARTVADLTYVGLSTAGAVRFRNTAGQIQLLADVAGWFAFV